jgi:hypothetical protein
MTRASRTLSVPAIVLGGYLAFLLTRYFYPPHIPRFQVESLFMWLVAAGVMAICLRASSGRDEEPAPGAPFTARHHAAVAASFAAIAFLEYGGALRVGLLSDDFVLADWAARREWVHLAETGFVRPVVPLLWAALSFVPGPLDLTLHAANVLLHALNAVLIVALAVRLGMGRFASLVAGLLFLTSPALSEAVVWCSGMQDVLMTTLGLSAILAATAVGMASERPQAAATGDGVMPDPVRTGVRALLAVGSAALALGVKETAVVIPVLAGVAAWAAPPGLKRGITRLTLAAMTLIAIIYGIYRVAGIYGVDSHVPSSYGQGVSRYLAKQLIVEPFATLAEPWSAVWARTHPFPSLVRALLILGLLVAGFSSWHRREAAFSRAAALAAWVLLAVLPVFSLFHVSPTLEGSRYVYLPAAGFAMLLASLMGALARTTPGHSASTLIGVLFLVFAAPSVSALGAEIGRWNDAARLRDAILAQVAGNADLAGCRSFTASGLADNVEGAYVFRNGLVQALAPRRGGASTGRPLEPARATPKAPAEHCQLSWLGDRAIVTADP